ncbi:class I adenylate-forming enzyme family protein [Nevskia soli]|uniref:class I adenylate-forming enzyme family protein n=1 Tax=Nevskia soli TaxID=418856 RepID=UPI0004A74402|nr:fatty acid--CoA ligase family protein [Nevskia soli]
MSPSIVEAFRDSALRHPAAPALVHDGQLISYRQLLALLHSAAASLHHHGVHPATVTGVVMEQTPLHCAVLLALLRLGALVVPLGPALPPAERLRLARKYGVQLLVTDNQAEPAGDIPLLRLAGLSARADEAEPDTGFRPTAATPARLALTSGTTGEPKAILHTHGELLERALRTTAGWDSSTHLLPPRLHLTVATAALLGTLCRGGTVVFPRGNEFPDLIAAVRQQAVTHLIQSPASALALAALRPQGGLPGLKQLRLVGGMPTAAQLDILQRRLTLQIQVTYALTELGVVAIATPETLAQAPASTGRVQSWVRLQIVDETGQVLPPGSTGEIRVITTPMPHGYYRDAELSRRRFRDGWFHTGDLGSIAADGLLRIEGRNDDLLNIGGHKVLPGPIEEILLRHPGVKQAALFSIAAADGSARLGAALVPDPKSEVEELAAWCRQHLGFYDERVLLLPALPRNELGKVLRGELRRMVMARRPVKQAR